MQPNRLPWLQREDPFPPTAQALDYPNGLLAAGADLSPERLLAAYQRGIFPWYNDDEPILWWSPAPRCVIYPEHFHCSRSLQKSMRRNGFTFSANRAFSAVIHACATSDEREHHTWISQDMQTAYCTMHQLGWAHSIEVWQGSNLVGGVYGLAIQRVFFGESMFSRVTDASKAALYCLCRALRTLDVHLLDCQVESPHLLSLGAQNISRASFENILQRDAHAVCPLPQHALATTIAILFP